MKVVLEYNNFKFLCLDMAKKIGEWQPDQIIAVCRGGFSAAHIIAKHLNIKCGVYIPDGNHLSIAGQYPVNLKKVVFIEDLIATGRTLENVRHYMNTLHKSIEWKFAPFLIDAGFDMGANKNDILTYGMISSDWIVMPYEAEDKVVEGDRGLFRDGTDQYGN